MDGCSRTRESGGYCQVHADRLKRSGTTDRVRGYAKDRTCQVEGCDDPVKAKGYCPFHYQRSRNGMDISAPKQAFDGSAETYNASHHRTRNARGPAKDHPCADGCGGMARQWAYNGNDPDERYDEERNLYFSIRPDFYDPLCSKCHSIRDAGTRGVELREYRTWKFRTGLSLSDIPNQIIEELTRGGDDVRHRQAG